MRLYVVVKASLRECVVLFKTLHPPPRRRRFLLASPPSPSLSLSRSYRSTPNPTTSSFSLPLSSPVVHKKKTFSPFSLSLLSSFLDFFLILPYTYYTMYTVLVLKDGRNDSLRMPVSKAPLKIYIQYICMYTHIHNEKGRRKRARKLNSPSDWTRNVMITLNHVLTISN